MRRSFSERDASDSCLSSRRGHSYLKRTTSPPNSLVHGTVAWRLHELAVQRTFPFGRNCCCGVRVVNCVVGKRVVLEGPGWGLAGSDRGVP